MQAIEHLLSVTSGPSGDVVTIHANLEGLEKLRTAIETLLAKVRAGQCDDEHFRTDSWAGRELSESMLEQEVRGGHKIVHHLKLFAWTDEWRQEHDL